ncbi:MAG: hypothetical protein PHH22_02470 [Clostridia bacterium]|nr:hypothetical protein [Clostridia bacterium]
MKKNIVKVLSLVLVIVLCFSFAAVFGFSNGGSNGGVKIPTGATVTAKGLDNLGGIIIGVLQTVAGIVAVSVLIFVGIKYLLASPGEKANIKGSLIPYVIGAILIFAAVPILGIIKQFTSGLKLE